MKSRFSSERLKQLYGCAHSIMMIIICIVGLTSPGHGLSCSPQAELVSQSPQAAPPPKSQEIQAKAEPDKIVPGPQNIKERTAILVFLGWMWASIVVLIYILRLKIKETDRLYFARYFSAMKK